MIIDPADFRFDSPSGFLVIDGVNGAGKSTLQRRVAEYLSTRGRSPVLTREPGATPIGRRLRQILLESKSEQIPPLAEAFLFSADRNIHVTNVIRPALTARQLVISDRYYYSTLAFQGFGRILDTTVVRELCQLAIAGVYPDLVLILDLEPSAGLLRSQARAAAGNTEKDSFEGEKLEFHQLLRDGFLELAAHLPEPFMIINAAESAEAVWSEVAPIIQRWELACQHPERGASK